MKSIVNSDARYCEKLTRTRGRTFSLASYFLPTRKRRAAFALYSFCRTADDIAQSTTTDWKAARRRLQDHRRDLTETLEGRPRGPVFREIRWAIREFSITGSLLTDFVDTMTHNVEPRAFETWEDLASYCDGMAGTISEMYGTVFGVPASIDLHDIALSYARTLGVAMQVTGMLRDVGDDARGGRCYLPAEDLSRFALTRDEVFEDPSIAQDARWHRLMTFEIARARTLYESALPGITMLSPDSQRCAAGCAIGYAAILDALEQIRYDSVSNRASVSTIARLGVLWEAWRFRGSGRLKAS